MEVSTEEEKALTRILCEHVLAGLEKQQRFVLARPDVRWAWDLDGVTPALKRGADVLRQRGQREGLTLLTTPEIPVDSDEALSFALIAVGLLRSHFYWCVDTDDANVWTVVSDASYEMPRHPPFERFCVMVQETIGQVPLPEHRAPLEAFARWLGLDAEIGPDGRLVVSSPEGKVTLGFDALTRVESMDVRTAGG